ncbi:oligopeptide/dipeptide ABC transporter ATPase [Pandoraea terrae]|uniref:Oligopeptide/dipeptide ABC transporter ATPase n=1 Tax=Pandoraea terrae TaxID=1537710 RepID=A0A5E4W0Z6_9BURK|nr:ABC transporter ATP-binding protein [Pandoraea terrae]VVE16950.1 oligopeptide/dipeptide ABC transporter ATPase [Pandoraea terrae]
MAQASSSPLLEVKDLEVEFTTSAGVARVLDKVSFALGDGETLGIVGESGCGKSMTSLAILRLIPSPPGRIVGGEIRLRGENLLDASEARIQDVRGNEISMIFQEPMTALNPVFTIGQQIMETLRRHQGKRGGEAREAAIELLRSVHIPEPHKRVDQYPHQLSGGMRQRAMIAMALACKPKVLIADEPTTALDVTVQAQIFDLMRELHETAGTAIMLITHNMGAIAELADRVIVMYAGRKVEEGRVEDVIKHPRHPYTQGLLRCVLQVREDVDENRAPLPAIPGVVPALTELGHGCAFAPRCPHANAHCREAVPPLIPLGEGQVAACWRAEELMRQGAV